MTSKIDAIAREMAAVLLESECDRTDKRFQDNIDRVMADAGLLAVSRGALNHLAAWVFSMIEQAKKETRQEARDHMEERGL